MPGIPKSNRCAFCKKRKIKCDENWPTCGACAKSNQTCSGPSNTTKFVHNGSHSGSSSQDSSHDLDLQSSMQAPGSIMVEVKFKAAEIGQGAFRRLRISNPRPALSTAASRLATRLTSYLATNQPNSSYDLLLSGHSLRFMPSRLEESQALQAALNCFLTTWSNFRGDASGLNILDAKTYIKALRSLQRALDDPETQFSSGTLAAIALLCRTEVTFDSAGPTNNANHLVGLSTLLVRRGPPKTSNLLDTYVSLECFGVVLSHSVVHGSDNFDTTPLWQNSLETAIASGLDSPDALCDLYRFNFQLAKWPEMCQAVRLILMDPHSTTSGTLAVQIFNKTNALIAELQEIDETTISRLRSECHISDTLVTDPASPIRFRTDFSSTTTAILFLHHAALGIVTRNLLASLIPVIGFGDYAELQRSIKEYSSRIWMTVPYMNSLGLMASTLFSGSLFLSLEAGSSQERAYIISAIRTWDARKKRFLLNDEELTQRILFTAKMMTGRLPLPPSREAAVNQS